jgi:Na+/H+-translocating membrane pyrophosphatase
MGEGVLTSALEQLGVVGATLVVLVIVLVYAWQKAGAKIVDAITETSREHTKQAMAMQETAKAAERTSERAERSAELAKETLTIAREIIKGRKSPGDRP